MRRKPLCAIRFQQVREPLPFAIPGAIHRPSDAADVVRAYLGDPDREHFVCVALNTRHEVTGLHTVSVGGLNSSPVHAREVFSFALAVHAAAIIIAHNHPSGTAEPSDDDRAVTDVLRAGGVLLGVEVLDHVVLGAPEAARPWVSLRETGAWGSLTMSQAKGRRTVARARQQPAYAD